MRCWAAAASPWPRSPRPPTPNGTPSPAVSRAATGPSTPAAVAGRPAVLAEHLVGPRWRPVRADRQPVASRGRADRRRRAPIPGLSEPAHGRCAGTGLSAPLPATLVTPAVQETPNRQNLATLNVAPAAMDVPARRRPPRSTPSPPRLPRRCRTPLRCRPPRQPRCRTPARSTPLPRPGTRPLPDAPAPLPAPGLGPRCRTRPLPSTPSPAPGAPAPLLTPGSSPVSTMVPSFVSTISIPSRPSCFVPFQPVRQSRSRFRHQLLHAAGGHTRSAGRPRCGRRPTPAFDAASQAVSRSVADHCPRAACRIWPAPGPPPGTTDRRAAREAARPGTITQELAWCRPGRSQRRDALLLALAQRPLTRRLPRQPGRRRPNTPLVPAAPETAIVPANRADAPLVPLPPAWVAIQLARHSRSVQRASTRTRTMLCDANSRKSGERLQFTPK